MTIGQLRALIVASLLCTTLVLGESARTPSSDAAVAAARARAALLVRAPGLAATTEPAASAAPQPPSTPAADVARPVPSSGSADGSAAPVAAAPAADSGAPVHGPPASTPAPPPAPKPKPSKVGHVFVITLDGAPEATTFSTGSPMPYLAGDLRPKGTLLPGFAPLDAAELPNQIALVSGQPPNGATQAECATYRDFPASATAGDDGILRADGCLYPNTTMTIADQVTSAGRSWKAYVEGMDSGPKAATSCRRPDVGAADDTLQPRSGDAYATRRNPFAYFHSLLDLGDCLANDVPLGGLQDDLRRSATTPSYTFINPDLCDAGGLPSCPDGRPAGPAAADAFLQTWVPRILASPAYRHDGLLVIALAAPAASADGTAPTGAPAATGALLLSRYATAGGEIGGAYDPYAVLRCVEDLLALDPLGYAASAPSIARKALPGAFGPRSAG